MIDIKNIRSNSAFTIVELLIIIVVIAILATIVVISYDGAFNKATEVSMQSDLKNASDSLELYRLDSSNGKYPSSLSDMDIEASADSEFSYTHESYNDNFCLSITSPDVDQVFHISSIGNKTPTEGPCDPLPAGPTAAACFAFSSGTITNYYNNEGNNSSNPACPRDVVIPESIGGVVVTTIGNSSFKSKQITSVVIPNTVTLVNAVAFHGNRLTYVNIPNSVTGISTSAFGTNKLRAVSMSSSLKYIGESAFNSNELTSIDLPDSLSTISTAALSNNELASLTIPDSVTTIGIAAFQNNNLGAVSLPSHLSGTRTNIGTEWVFRGNPSLSFTVRP